MPYSTSITGESGDQRLESGTQDISNSLKTGNESGDAQVPEGERNLSFFFSGQSCIGKSDPTY
jgi:hypothetical protein